MSNAHKLAKALDYLQSLIATRLNQHLEMTERKFLLETETLFEKPLFSSWLSTFQPTYLEYILILLALVPHLKPSFFNQIISHYLPEGSDLPEFGGARSGNHRGILPTGEMAQFILAGDDIEKRLQIYKLFHPESRLSKLNVLYLEATNEGEPPMSGRLLLSPDIIEQLLFEISSKPHFSTEFPAELLTTDLYWDDLILLPHTLQQINEIQHWIKHSDTLLHQWKMKNRIKPGYRALFYGPPGTGKTLTAMLLGKQTKKDVYRIDLSRMVSKYIGETEKNLARLFNKAENKNWILFFDEADALFSKRTEVRDSHDKYANQEVAYLLQRIETYNGLIILATNQRNNIDDAFIRRFQSIIHFPIPRADERLKVWQKLLPKQITIAEDICWQKISTHYELSGANILNIIQYCAIEALAKKDFTLGLKKLEAAIYREQTKEGKIM